jgi:hypothetical protein
MMSSSLRKNTAILVPLLFFDRVEAAQHQQLALVSLARSLPIMLLSVKSTAVLLNNAYHDDYCPSLFYLRPCLID